jgi:hypothetical protein
MKKKRAYSVAYFACLLLTGLVATPFTHCQSQTGFAYAASLDTIKQAALYRISLPPELVATCKANMADLRIAGPEGRYIPYVLRTDLPILSTEGFREFPILSNERLKDSSTEIVVANPSATSISSLLFIIRNVSARRTCTISGSDDRQKWFVVREHIELEEAASDTADRFVESIAFPPSNYRYFRMTLDDKGLLPINILQSGVAVRSTMNGKYREVPDPVIHQKDSSNRHSYITLQYGKSYRIDKLELRVGGPVLYRRHAWVYDNENRRGWPVAEMIIYPSNTSFGIPSLKTSRLLIDISNDDDVPLSIEKASTAQLDQYLLAYLQPGTGYRLLTGNPQADIPEYDLRYFTDSLTVYPGDVGVGPLQPLSAGPLSPVTPGRDHSIFLLWSIISLVLVLLIFLSFKMMNAIPKKEGDESRKEGPIR